MNESRINLVKKALLGVAAAGLLALSTASASAAIACRGDICWRVHEPYAYPPPPMVVIHPDYWRPPTASIIIHQEGWRPVVPFTQEYIVRDYAYGDPDWR